MLSRYGLSADGELLVQHEFDIDKTLPDLPRIGVRMILPGNFEKFGWFGRGPIETYCDRKSAGVVQRHESSVTDQYVPYILPQEHGNHTDVIELDLIGRHHSLSIIAATAIEASARIAATLSTLTPDRPAPSVQPPASTPPKPISAPPAR